MFRGFTRGYANLRMDILKAEHMYNKNMIKELEERMERLDKYKSVLFQMELRLKLRRDINWDLKSNIIRTNREWANVNKQLLSLQRKQHEILVAMRIKKMKK